MASPTYERLIRYIVESMTPEKVMALETPTDDLQAAQLVEVLKSQASPVDTYEPTNEEILAGLERSLHQVFEGKTIPLSKLWDGIDVEG